MWYIYRVMRNEGVLDENLLVYNFLLLRLVLQYLSGDLQQLDYKFKNTTSCIYEKIFF